MGHDHLMPKGYQTHPRLRVPPFLAFLHDTPNLNHSWTLSLTLRKRQVVHTAMVFVDSTHRGLRTESHCKERSLPVSPRSKAVKSMYSMLRLLFLGGSTRNDKTLLNPELGFPGVSEFNIMLSCCNRTQNSSHTSDLQYLRRYAATTFRD